MTSLIRLLTCILLAYSLPQSCCVERGGDDMGEGGVHDVAGAGVCGERGVVGAGGYEGLLVGEGNRLCPSSTRQLHCW